MAQEETILLHFDIDEQPAVNSIKDLRQANSQLRAERDKVNLSTKEGRDLVEKLNVTIDKNNKLIKDNSSALEKQRQNVGNYSKSIQEAAGELNIMGTNVGALGTKLTSFVNPASAAVAVVSALGAAYARSSIGAKDLEFASNQLAFATTLLTDEFASLFSSVEDGQGFFSKLTNSIISRINPAIGVMSSVASFAKEKLDELSDQSGLVQAAVNERLAENAELMTELSNTETDLNTKRQIALKIQDNLTINANERLDVINKEIAQYQILAAATKDRGPIERIINKLKAEQSSITTQETKGIEKVNKLLNAAINAEQKRLAAMKEQANVTARKIKAQEEADERELRNREVSFNDDPTSTEFDPQAQFEKDKQNIDDLLGLTRTAEDEKRAELLRTNALKEELAEEEYQRNLQLAASSRDLAGTLASIAEEGTVAQKALALTTIAINSGIGVSEAVKAGAGIPWPANLGAILSGITAVLAGIAQAKSLLGFAEGGYTGHGGKYEPAGIVHRGEYVAPQHIVNSPVARPHIQALESMRVKGYADGGFVANSNMEASRQAQMLAQAFKNMPPIFASWTEGRAVGRKLEFKEKVSSR